MESTRTKASPQGVCAVTGKPHPMSKLILLRALRPSISDTLRRRHPELTEESLLSVEAVNAARLEYVRNLLETQVGDLTKLDEEVVESLHKHEVLSERPLSETEEVQHLTFGQRVADKIADFGGSWTFILSFCMFLVLWIVINAGVLLRQPFDPYPFILLNLAFSLQAAYAAPLILLAQTRQADRDKAAAENDARHREDLAREALRQQDESHTQLNLLVTLINRNTELTELTHKLSLQIDGLTRDIHQQITGRSEPGSAP